MLEKFKRWYFGDYYRALIYVFYDDKGGKDKIEILFPKVRAKSRLEASAFAVAWAQIEVDENWKRITVSNCCLIGGNKKMEKILVISLSYSDYGNRLPREINDIIKPFKACQGGGGIMLGSNIYDHDIYYPEENEKELKKALRANKIKFTEE